MAFDFSQGTISNDNSNSQSGGFNFSNGTPVQSTTQQQPQSLADSVWGSIMNAGKTVGNFLTSSEQAFGTDVGQGLALGSKDYSNAQNSQSNLQDMISKTQQTIAQMKKEGKDTSHLEAVLNQVSPGAGNSLLQSTAPDIANKSNTQILGDAGGVLLDTLSAGSYGGLTNGLADTATKKIAQLGLNSKKIAPIIKTAVKATEGAALGYGYDVANNAQSGETNGSIFTPKAGTVIGASLPFLSALTGALSKEVLGATTGVGKNVIQRAIDNPDAVSQAVKKFGSTPEAKQSLVDRAKAAISDYLHRRNEEYGSNINNLTSKSNFQGKGDVLASFEKNVGQFGGSIKNGELSFTDSTLTNTDQNNLKQAFNTINNWKNTSVKGMDNLRQAIGNLMDEFSLTGNTRANVVLGNVKDDLVKSVENNANGYKKILSQYSQKTQTVRNLLKELQLSGQAKPSTQLNNVLKIFKKDPSVIATVKKTMGEKDAEKFLNDISGAVLSDWIPTGKMGNTIRTLLDVGGAGAAVATGHPLIAAGTVGALGAASPKIAGKAATTAGKLLQKDVGTAARRIVTRTASNL